VKYPKGANLETIKLTINASEGLHARPAQLFCALAQKFKSEIKVRNVSSGSKFVNAKSILFVLTLGVEHGHEVEITAAGSDEVEASQALGDLIGNNFPA
jgi:phosphotransferase system HPr (HPr) family protein